MTTKYRTQQIINQDIATIKGHLTDIIIRHPNLDAAYNLVKSTIDDNRFLSENKHAIIIGEAGCGKSSLIDLYQADYHEEIHEFTLGTRTNSPAIFSSVPSPVTPKSMSAELLKAIGDRTGLSQTSYQLTERLTYHIQNSQTKVVILDEFQHLLSLGTKNRTQSLSTRLRESMDWLKSLTNKTDATYVLMGMPELLYLIQADPQMSRRFANTHYLGPFIVPSKEENQLSIFADELLLKTSEIVLKVYDSTYFQEIDYFQDHPDDAFRLYAATEGRPSKVKQLIIDAACIAYKAKVREINMSHFATALDRQERASQEAKKMASDMQAIRVKQASKETGVFINPFTEKLDSIRHQVASLNG